MLSPGAPAPPARGPYDRATPSGGWYTPAFPVAVGSCVYTHSDSRTELASVTQVFGAEVGEVRVYVPSLKKERDMVDSRVSFDPADIAAKQQPSPKSSARKAGAGRGGGTSQCSRWRIETLSQRGIEVSCGRRR